MKAVIDAKSDEHLTIDKAISKGILNQAKGIYHNTMTSKYSVWNIPWIGADTFVVTLKN